jgi:hypothetical protein
VDETVGEYLTIFEVSEKTKFTVAALRKYVLMRTIPFHKINRAIRFKPDEINAWIASGGKGRVTSGGGPEAQGNVSFGGKA